MVGVVKPSTRPKSLAASKLPNIVESGTISKTDLLKEPVLKKFAISYPHQNMHSLSCSPPDTVTSPSDIFRV